MEDAIRCKDTVFYLCACPDGADYYLQYPELDFAHRFEKQTNLKAFHVTQGSKYFITPSEKNNHELFDTDAATIGYGKSDFTCGLDKLLLIYDDGAWQLQEDKFNALWRLSYSDNECIITLWYEEDLLGSKLTKEMKKDILRHWDIIYLTDDTYII